MIAPRSVYGATKAALGLLLSSSWSPRGLGVCWARVFNVTGPGEHPDRLVPSVVRSLIDGTRIDLSPGAQKRDFLDVADVADALVALSEAAVGGPVNVCSGVPISLRELFEQLADRAGADRALLSFGSRPYAEHDAMMAVGRNERLTTATEWRPELSVDAMIGRVVDYWKGICDREGES